MIYRYVFFFRFVNIQGWILIPDARIVSMRQSLVAPVRTWLLNSTGYFLPTHLQYASISPSQERWWKIGGRMCCAWSCCGHYCRVPDLTRSTILHGSLFISRYNCYYYYTSQWLTKSVCALQFGKWTYVRVYCVVCIRAPENRNTTSEERRIFGKGDPRTKSFRFCLNIQFQVCLRYFILICLNVLGNDNRCVNHTQFNKRPTRSERICFLFAFIGMRKIERRLKMNKI